MPEVFHRAQFGGSRRQEDRRDVLRHVLSGTPATSCPLTDQAVLMADAGFVLKPSPRVPFGRSTRWAFSVRGNFFYTLRRCRHPARGDAAGRSCARSPASSALDAEALLDDPLEIDAAPPHHAVNGRIRPVSTISASSAGCLGKSRDVGHPTTNPEAHPARLR